MAQTEKIALVLEQKVKHVRETPEGFAFFVSIHDFVAFIEATPSFAVFFIGAKQKGSRARDLPVKYSMLKNIYQGIEDLDVKTAADLGHDRFVAIRELGLIRKNEVSNNNAFWKHREFLRKLAGDIHVILRGYLLEAEGKI